MQDWVQFIGEVDWIGGEAAPAVPVAPVNTVAPLITGSAVEGSVLTCSTGTWTGSPTPTFTYQWRNATVNIGGETASTYTTVAGDVGDAIDCVVTATNSEGSDSESSSNSITVTEAPPDAGDSLALFNEGGVTLLHVGMI